MTRQYEFMPVHAIYGTADYDQSRAPGKGYAVRDRFQRGRHLGYVARRGREWQAVRPEKFDPMLGFHRSRHHLHGSFSTRWDAAEHLRRLAIRFDEKAKSS